jgi:thiamine pyrophosphate-dependent acetolactate synthase large subunit-like protein
MAMQLSDCFAYCASRQKTGIVITSAGTTSGAWWKVTHDMDRVLYLGASMSMISMFGAGIALGARDLPVWIFMGDGAFCMNPGMLMVERDLDLPNLKHFLVSNRVYGATGAARLPNAKRNDYLGIARAVGIERLYCIDSMDELRRQFDEIVDTPGHTFTVLEVAPPPRDTKEGGVPIDDTENKFRFGRYIERTANIKVFRQAAVPPVSV